MDMDAPGPALQAFIKHALMWLRVVNTLEGPIHLKMSLVPKMAS